MWGFFFFLEVKCAVVINRRSDLCYGISEYSFIFGLGVLMVCFTFNYLWHCVYNRSRMLVYHIGSYICSYCC